MQYRLCRHILLHLNRLICKLFCTFRRTSNNSITYVFISCCTSRAICTSSQALVQNSVMNVYHTVERQPQQTKKNWCKSGVWKYWLWASPFSHKKRVRFEIYDPYFGSELLIGLVIHRIRTVDEQLLCAYIWIKTWFYGSWRDMMSSSSLYLT